FVALNEYFDGADDRGTDGDVVDALYDWLVADLAANTQPAVFVIGHEPAYPVGAHTGDSLNKYSARRDRFWKLLNDRKVIAYICGHTHYYSALQQAQTGAYPCDAFTWQIDCGNAGNPRELEQTFVDVAVTDTQVTFNTWQGLEGDPYTITDTWTVQIPTLPDYFDDFANSDIPVRGTIAGDYTDTQSSNDVYEAITERQSGGKPSNRYSHLEHKWTINVTGGDTVTFNLEAYMTAGDDGDGFVFAYSTDDSSYTDMVTVWKTIDDDTPQSCPLPASTTGTIYIRVTDTDQTSGNRSLDTIYIDHMYIRSEGEGEPDIVPPTPAPTWAEVPHATGSTSISMTATTASDPSGVEYYFACTAGGGHDSDWQDSPSYEDTGLSPEITYTYQVQARDKSVSQNETGWSGEASATTDPQAGDIVTITKAEYKVGRSELNVEATCISSGEAVLQIYAYSESSEVGDWHWYGEMTYDSRKDIYKLKIRPVDDPVVHDPEGKRVMVTSDLGGLDIIEVTYK
ncbi:MAG: metallophosphoesterase family protein, partial [Planctomycetota bacterium]